VVRCGCNLLQPIGVGAETGREEAQYAAAVAVTDNCQLPTDS
jgi:hypothetical protein